MIIKIELTKYRIFRLICIQKASNSAYIETNHLFLRFVDADNFLKMTSIRFLLPLFLLTTQMSGQHITNYNQLTGWGISRDYAEGVVCLRRFFADGNTYYFAVIPSSLQTRVIRADSVFVVPESWEMLRFLFSATPYIHALNQAEELGKPIQDAVYTRFSTPRSGIDLTIDLCPSKRPLDRIVFTDLIREIGKVEKPVPVAICITGNWIRTHQSDLNWLDSLTRANDLSIVWINHSYNHYVIKKAPLHENFMLASGTDIDGEVMNNETEMLQRNIIPSVFFRFPGLVSDNHVYERILELGLIPVGTDAWLAKGQKPGNGSIVLIHANGNEPVGVKDFIALLKRKHIDLISGRWELFDLRESLIGEISH